MARIERYIFKTAFGAFLACLISLTAVIWVTQALREIDLLTGKGQTILMFLAVTVLSLPALVTVIAPVALFIATLYTLNKLNSDSELIVMSASGMAPWRLIRPFLFLGFLVCLLVGYLTIQLMPSSFQELRDLITKVRADFVSNIVKEGQFTKIENGVTFHYREKSGDALLGIFIDDRREPDKAMTYLAERGRTVEVEGRSYLLLEKGGIHKRDPKNRDVSIVQFERYAVDLSSFEKDAGEVVYKPRERSTAALFFPDSQDNYYKLQSGRFRAELHDRLSGWLYPLAMLLIACAALGEARTTRQGRGMAIALAVIAVVGLRIAGFAASSAVVRSEMAVFWVYGVPVLACSISLLLILQNQRIKFLLNIFEKLSGYASHISLVKTKATS